MRSSSFTAAFSIVLVGVLGACGGDDDDVLFAPGGVGAGASGAAGTSGATKGGSGGVGSDPGDAGAGGSASAGKGGTTGKGGSGGKGGTSAKGGTGGTDGEGGEGGEAGSDAGGSGGVSGKGGSGGTGGKAGAGGKSGAAGTSAAGAAGNGNAGTTSAGGGGANAGAAGSTVGGAAGNGTAGAAGACPSPPLGYFAKATQTNFQIVIDESGSMAQSVCSKACGVVCCPGESKTVSAFAVAGTKAFLGVAPGEPPLGFGLSAMPSGTGCPAPAAPLIPLGAFPANKNALLGGLDQLDTMGSSTTGPGIEGASKHLESVLLARPAEGRAIIVLTDGTEPTCGAPEDKTGTKAAAASFARGIPVHVLAIFPDGPGTQSPRPGDLAGMNALAKAGGTTQAAAITEDDDIGAQLAVAFERVRRETFSCRFDPTPASGSFDLVNDKISLATDGGELALESVPNAQACSGKGYYLDGKHLALCPALCTIARQQTKPSVLVTKVTCSP